MIVEGAIAGMGMTPQPLPGDLSSWIAEVFFARHETFCPRYGWLKKGFDGVKADPRIFDSDEAIVSLGVGKNMVKSIRFWCTAFHLIGPKLPESGQDTINKDVPVSIAPLRMSGQMAPTEFGRALLSNEGWDPYLEDPASLWLLHWKLFSVPIAATAWSLAINFGHLGSFTLRDFGQSLLDQREPFSILKRYSDSSILKDASCFIRMYAPVGRQVSEEIECPFTSLGLLLPGDEPQSYRFNLADKSTLPCEIFLAACFDYASQIRPGARTLPLNDIAYGVNSPGAVFKISETDIGYRLEKAVEEWDEKVHFIELYGSRQLQFDTSPAELFREALERYYGQRVEMEQNA